MFYPCHFFTKFSKVFQIAGLEFCPLWDVAYPNGSARIDLLAAIFALAFHRKSHHHNEISNHLSSCKWKSWTGSKIAQRLAFSTVKLHEPGDQKQLMPANSRYCSSQLGLFFETVLPSKTLSAKKLVPAASTAEAATTATPALATPIPALASVEPTKKKNIKKNPSWIKRYKKPYTFVGITVDPSLFYINVKLVMCIITRAPTLLG